MELVTGAMGSLLLKLGELVKEEYDLQAGVREQVQSLIGELEIMHVALRKVAEVPHKQLDNMVKLWAHEVRELSYDMEDVVDTHLVRVEDGGEAMSNPHRLKVLMQKMGNLFSKGKARHQIAKAIQDFKKQIQEVANKYDRYKVEEIVATPAASTRIDPRLEALYREAKELVGIDGRREELIKMLSEGDNVSNKAPFGRVRLIPFRLRSWVSREAQKLGLQICGLFWSLLQIFSVLLGFRARMFDRRYNFEAQKIKTEPGQTGSKKPKIVSIVGFGGLGKTTLAKAVYDKINQGFNYSGFVSIGRNPDVKKVFRDILIHLNKQKYTDLKMMMLDERQLIEELQEFLKNKRYLIIIDDIWDEELWGVIKCAFSNENNLGSRLITTTRKVSVSEACCSSSDDIVYKMEPLSDDDSQRLFYQRIFPDRSGCPPELEQVSRDILKKCGGVPLAIITIASLLAGKKQTKDEWYTLLNSIGRGLTKPTCVEDMQRILSFSYYDLPPELKTCLLYISVFPEDYVIDRDQLIWMWIAEGFIQCEEQQTSLFELGESYFNELINRSMIQPLESYFDKEGRGKEYRVHDMVLDLICALSSEENFVTILDGGMPNLQSKVRRLSLQNSKVDQTTPPYSVSQVRSIAIYPPAINLMPPLSSFRVLRVLNLRKCDLGESINLRDVGNLFHLRYLGLANTGICELPEDIGKLQFLQVLDVTGNRGLSVLPSTVVKLRRLMCLDVDGIRLPDGIGNLTSMEVLHIIFACPNIVKELRNLTRLREFTIIFPPDGPNLELEEAFVESLRSLQNIQSLDLACPFGSMDLFGEHWVPPPCLRSFRLAIREFSTMPAWVKRDHSHLSNLSDLHIAVNELRQEDLQTLGMLPALRSLQINITHQKQILRLVVADWFKYVIFFEVKCELAGHIVFQRGALSRAEEVEFPFDVRMAKDDGNDDFDAGLGNLLSLRAVSVTIFRDGDTVGEAKEAEAALRHAVDAHPNHPTIKIDFKPFLLALDGDFSLRRRRRGGRAGARGRAGATSASDGDKDEDGPEKSS